MKRVSFGIIFILFFSNVAFPQISVTFVGDTTKIWDSNFGWACAGEFFPIIHISQDTIYITECDTMDHATCSCLYTVCTSLTGFNVGTYTAIISRQWKYYRDTTYGYTIQAGSVTFTISKPPTLSNSISFYQSGCMGPDYVFPNENYIPNNFAMLTNYPNPFNPGTTIKYTILQSYHVVLTIYNSSGQRIVTLLNKNVHAGTHEINFDGTHLSSGVYLCVLDIGIKKLTTNIILLK